VVASSTASLRLSLGAGLPGSGAPAEAEAVPAAVGEPDADGEDEALGVEPALGTAEAPGEGEGWPEVLGDG
jgi:hypothetical protein